MPRLITLSRAARLVGVKRGTLQKKIRQGELRTFEGELLLADLLHAYPQTEVEDSTMLERVETIMEQAVNKIYRGSADKPSSDTLAARILSLGQELAKARQEARCNGDLINDLARRFEELSAARPDTADDAFSTIKAWFFNALKTLEAPDDDAGLLAKEAFLRVMAAQVRLLPSGHEFLIEGTDSILEAGLRGGLALNYGCSNGNCGLCKCKVVSGQVKKIALHDYVLTETEKALGYILACSNTAVTDVVLEADEALGAHDIPAQQIAIRIRKIDRPDDRVVVLQARTPRTQRLRFLAGQYLALGLDVGITQHCSIASCPCDDMNLEFHVPVVAGDPFSGRLGELRANQTLTIEGPHGDFTLDEDSPRSLLFIAVNAGFGPVKSLIEHAMALDTAEEIHLLWLATPGHSHYLDNLCRSWADALDNFHYLALRVDESTTVEQQLGSALARQQELPVLDCYVCAPAPLLEPVEALLHAAGAAAAHIRLEPLRQD
jgi:CDP-4-dehydro-6-deoxyglucose reductase